uniref:Epoxide hydrolase n=1 Tax=Drosophila rhopaloa TaxID=1041015 RepID=A0A6P4FV67_DRORH
MLYSSLRSLKIHFIHAKPTQVKGQKPKKVLPLLLMHGWPGTVREFYDFIPLLTTPSDKSDYVFEVIAPSLPGYGWSQGSSKTGFGVAQVAVVMRNLMLRVGFNKFLVQGGDWGSIIGSNVASLFPENVLGYHSNMCGNNSPLGQIKLVLASFFPSWFVDSQHASFYKGLGHMFSTILEEMGYAHIQASKPDTIGNALIDNPAGLAAYILEKFSTWTNPSFRSLPDGGLTKRFTYDQLLDNVMIYYVTNSITTSVRLYSESMVASQFALAVDSLPIKAKSGCTRFAHEIVHTSDSVLANKFPNLVHSTHFSDGGHFPAFELPQQLYDDFVSFVQKADFPVILDLRSRYGVSVESKRDLHLERVPTPVPTGCARFKSDIMQFLDIQLQDKFTNLVHSTYHKQGGHFAALEVPKVLYQDFIEFVKKVERKFRIKSL